jgi:hypothetical protein
LVWVFPPKCNSSQARTVSVPKLEVPAVKALNNALVGREFIFMYAGVQSNLK